MRRPWPISDDDCQLTAGGPPELSCAIRQLLAVAPTSARYWDLSSASSETRCENQSCTNAQQFAPRGSECDSAGVHCCSMTKIARMLTDLPESRRGGGLWRSCSDMTGRYSRSKSARRRTDSRDSPVMHPSPDRVPRNTQPILVTISRRMRWSSTSSSSSRCFVASKTSRSIFASIADRSCF